MILVGKFKTSASYFSILGESKFRDIEFYCQKKLLFILLLIFPTKIQKQFYNCQLWKAVKAGKQKVQQTIKGIGSKRCRWQLQIYLKVIFHLDFDIFTKRAVCVPKFKFHDSSPGWHTFLQCPVLIGLL